jgi:hypothetical protein
LAAKKKCIESGEFIYSKKPYQNFHTDARYSLFEARKETHEQRKTKINIDEFRSGTTNITLIPNDTYFEASIRALASEVSTLQ